MTAGLIAQRPQGAFATPVEGGSLDASVVLGNENAVRSTYNGHDADATIHVQSSTLAARPAASIAHQFWVTTDGLRAYVDSGSVWGELAYLPIVGGTVTGATTFSAAVRVNRAGASTPAFAATDGATFPALTGAGTTVGVCGDSGAISFMGVSVGDGVRFDAYRCRTSIAAPSAVQTGDALLILGAHGYRNAAFSATDNGYLAFLATENWTATAAGTQLQINVTPNGTTSNINALTIQHSGLATFAKPINVSDATDATSGTDGSLQTSGGLSIVKKAWIGTGLTLAAGAFTMSAAASQIIPGATSFSIRNNANGADNWKVADSGDCTARMSVAAPTLFATAAAVNGGAGTVCYGATTQTTIGANGGASALTANPLGYIKAFVGTTAVIIPYYNA